MTRQVVLRDKYIVCLHVHGQNYCIFTVRTSGFDNVHEQILIQHSLRARQMHHQICNMDRTFTVGS